MILPFKVQGWVMNNKNSCLSMEKSLLKTWPEIVGPRSKKQLPWLRVPETYLSCRKDTKFYPVIGVTLVILMMVSLQMLKDLIPTANAVMFYVCQFFVYATLPFLLLFMVPVIASLYKVKEEWTSPSSCDLV